MQYRSRVVLAMLCSAAAGVLIALLLDYLHLNPF